MDKNYIQVLKKEVDSYKIGKRIPVCQLQAIATSQVNHLPNLLCPIKLEGTKDHHCYIQLFRVTTGNVYLKLYISYKHDLYKM